MSKVEIKRYNVFFLIEARASIRTGLLLGRGLLFGKIRYIVIYCQTNSHLIRKIKKLLHVEHCMVAQKWSVIWRESIKWEVI